MKTSLIVIPGKVPAKSNCYKVARRDGHGALVKHDKLVVYESMFWWRCPIRGKRDKPLITEPFAIRLKVYFHKKACDLDNSLKIILDILQRKCHVIADDNLCARIEAEKFIDRENPRIEFELETLTD